jgi:hypothetical protein
VSRLLPDFLSRFVATRLTIGLSGDGIAIVQNKVFVKDLVYQQFIASVQNADWPSLLQQLDAALSQLKLPKNTPITVVLSSDFVRYLMLPAQPFAMNSAENAAYTQAAYRDIYGLAADNWHIKCDDAAPDQNRLAVAVDAQLMAALSQLAAQYSFKLKSVQPQLMAAFNGLMPQLARKNGYLVLLEQSKLLLIRLQNGQCQHLRALALNGDWQLDLLQAVERESALNDDRTANDKQLFIYAPAQKNTAINQIQGWKTQKIGLKNTLSNPPYSMLEAVL